MLPPSRRSLHLQCTVKCRISGAPLTYSNDGGGGGVGVGGGFNRVSCFIPQNNPTSEFVSFGQNKSFRPPPIIKICEWAPWVQDLCFKIWKI